MFDMKGKKLITVAIFLGLAYCLQAQELVIVHFNDTHSHFEPVRGGAEAGLGGVIERAARLDSLRKAVGRRNVLLLHAGDFNQGTSYYTELGGMLEVNTVNAMGYDCVNLGNHEFDNGIEDLTARVARLKCPVVCANYDFSSFELGKYVKPYCIVRRGGLKIGIIGLLTDISRVVDRNISDRIPALDAVEVTNSWASYLKNGKKCDLVIALTHIGFEGEKFTDPELVAATENVDLVVGGHSHTFLEEIRYFENAAGKMVPVVQNGCWGEWFTALRVR